MPNTYYFIIHKYPMTLAAAQRILADKTHHIPSATHGNRDWQRRPPPTCTANPPKSVMCPLGACWYEYQQALPFTFSLAPPPYILASYTM
ncbi:hypothetical protein [Aeromonas veronii]|uniref:hypothetical protein n=1 Tax=Aeromonas veronii TaxID=654 RepID=UPI002B45D769|nr:hypothetical protein [Aeromonas veronii]